MGGVANWSGFDWVLVGLLAWSTIAGLTRGIVRSIFGLVGIVAGCLLATANSQAVGLRLAGLITSPATARIVAFLLIVSVVVVAFTLAGRAMRKSAKAVGLGMVDQVAGGVFGFARGVLLGVGMMLALTAAMPQSNWMGRSTVAPYFLQGAHEVSYLIPQDLQAQLVFGRHRTVQ